MLNTRLTVARTVTTGLTDLEKQIDTGLIMHGQLLGDLIAGRRSANLPLTAGEDALEAFHQAASHLIAARRAMNKAHYAFRHVRDQLRLPVHAYGDMGDTPEDEPRGSIESSGVRVSQPADAA